MKTKPLKGYTISHEDSTIIMNKKFAAAANRYGTPEYKLLLKIREDYPLFQTETRSGRKRTTCNANKRLTYANMRLYIQCQLNSKELLETFDKIKVEAKGKPSPYAFVRAWFVERFPDYKNFTTLEENVENMFTQKAG